MTLSTSPALRHISTIAIGVMTLGVIQLSGSSPVSSDPADPGVVPDTRMDATTLSAERYRPKAIDWQPCADNPAVDCGVLTLPVDYDEPRGETFDMAVARTRATDPDRRIGVLFTNPGGPGLSGVDFVTGTIAFAPVFAPIREQFDVVSFDPRGVGDSRPIQCQPGNVDLPSDLADDVAVAAAFDQFSHDFAAECAELDGTFASTVSTNNVARDMDRLRRALGEREITYSSGSYGTLLGAVYASLYPRRVRRGGEGEDGLQQGQARDPIGMRAGVGGCRRTAKGVADQMNRGRWGDVVQDVAEPVGLLGHAGDGNGLRGQAGVA